MKTSKLRIGNIMDGGTITEIGKDYLKFRDDYQGWNTKDMVDGLKHLRPIKLTERQLLRFGFEKREPNDDGLIYGILNFTIVLSHTTDNDWGFFLNGYHNDCHIKYVHQLQNLYFVLTAKELKYKK